MAHANKRFACVAEVFVHLWLLALLVRPISSKESNSLGEMQTIPVATFAIDAYPPKPFGGILQGFLTHRPEGSATTYRLCSSRKWFNDTAATLLCRQAGYKGGGQRTDWQPTSSWAPSMKRAAFPYFNCSSASKFSQCRSGEVIMEPACEDDDIVFVKCWGDNSLRLVDGNSTAGRLQVFFNGTWSNVCSDSIKKSTANTACNFALGSSSWRGDRVSGDQFDPSGRRFKQPSLGLPFIGCTGMEDNFVQCVQEDKGGKPYQLPQCYEKSSDAALVCWNNTSSARAGAGLAGMLLAVPLLLALMSL